MSRITRARTLTPRDQAILTDVARCRVTSVSQLHQEHWPRAKLRTCQERLEQLQKAGYLHISTVPGEKPGTWETAVSLDGRGKRWLCGPEGPGMDLAQVKTRAGREAEVVHQIRTSEVYFRLSPEERATWRTGTAWEVELKGRRGVGGLEVPDAVYDGIGGGEVFVETDTGHYSAGQVREKVAGFGGHKTVWVCPAGREGFLTRWGVTGEVITY